ncbi:MAG: hypothetical protein E4H01_04320 [Lysobacterales bacterium]|nr:MAG: hypothetical protein E4H01_04320 [Xanthomonadales bacterium]
MEFTVPEYSESQVDRAGRMLVNPTGLQNPDDALEILNNWQSSHALPLNTFTVTLRNKARQIQEDALVAQRIKRLSSIALKLRRFPTMTLSQMQDLGGCRAIVSSVAGITKLRKLFDDARFEHELHTADDYIAAPKDTGYRSIRPIYQYQNGNKPQK